MIFDFDGLILDTEVPVYEAWREVYTEHGAELDLVMWQGIIGTAGFDPATHLEERIGRPLDWDSLNPRRRARRDELQAAEELRPGISDWLADAANAGLAVGIASSSPRDWVTGHLGRLGIGEHFSCIRCVDDVGEGKPSPASYLAVLAAFGVDGSEALALEDSVHGVAAAKAAGMRCVAVPGDLTRDMDFSSADLVVESLDELTLTAAASLLGLQVTSPATS